MKKLITYFIKYPITGNVLMVLIILFGVMGMFSLRKTFFPESESHFIVAQAVYPGASPVEIEKMVVLKIEDNIDGLSGIDRVTSTSAENLGTVTIEVNKDYDIQVVLQDIKNAMDRINSFPDAMEPPSVFIKERVSFAISFALSGDVDLVTLKAVGQKVEADLKAMDGVSKVSLKGFPSQEIEISFRENDLKKFNLSFDQVNRAVRSENVDITGGTIKTAKEDLRIRGNNKRYTAKEMGDLVVAKLDNRLVRLSDVASVKDVWADEANRKYFNGKNGVVVNINNTIHEDVSLIAQQVQGYMVQFNSTNDVVKADLIKDGSKVVEERIELLGNNGIVGFILVLVFLSMFLHPSLAGWVAAAIPISFAGMFILAAFYGITLNVISLFGMIIVIGILVDDGIVIAENIYQHYERGKDPVQAAVDGTMEVMPAVFSAIMTTIVAFSIFFLLDGKMGDFFPEMGFVVIGTLIFSLVEGVFILPAHIAHSAALKKDKKAGPTQKIIDWFTRFLNAVRVKTYEPVLRFAMKYPLHIVMITVGLMVVTVGGMKAGLIKATMFPSIEGDALAVNLKLQPGTSEKVTAQWMDYIEDKVQEVNKELSEEAGEESLFVGIEKTVGPSAETGALNIILIPIEQRTVSSSTITSRMKEVVGEIPGADLLSFEQATPFGKPISIALYSDDHEELSQASTLLKAEMARMGNLKNIESSDKKGLQEVNIKLKEKAYLLGFSTSEILREIRKGFFGLESQRLQKGIDEVKVWLRYDEQDRSSIADLENMRIRVRNTTYLLSDLVDIETDRGIVGIDHLDGRRSVKITADLLSPEVDNSQQVLMQLEGFVQEIVLPKYTGVNHSLEGQYRDQSKMFKSIKVVGPIVLILMLVIIVLAFRSFLQTAAVFLMIPFGFIGVAWGHFLHGDQMSIFSYFGMIALIGIMVNDSLVFISTFNLKMKRGSTFSDAIWESGVSRFRPIVLTSLTTIAGLAPLIAETSFQAQFLIPMAIAIAYGLAIATLLTLVFLPAVLILFNKLRFGTSWLLTGKRLSAEEREPAVKEIPFENMKID